MQPSICCTLCKTDAGFLAQMQGRNYYACPGCKAIIMDPAQYISPKKELARYLEHENDIEDAGYQQFVFPLVDGVRTDYQSDGSGLDYGSGTGPVAAKLLRDDGFAITTYDPFFDKNEAALRQPYDFIICSEVAEHFHHPHKEFQLLYSLLKPGGRLYCMTLRYSPDIDFKGWYYNNDETHVIFYQDETARWIKEHYGFSNLLLKDRLIILQK